MSRNISLNNLLVMRVSPVEGDVDSAVFAPVRGSPARGEMDSANFAPGAKVVARGR